MLKFVWRRWIGDAVARSVASRLQLEERFQGLEGRIGAARHAGSAEPVVPAATEPGNVIDFKGRKLIFEGTPGDVYVENLAVFHRDKRPVLPN